jgi:F-type H+-transporting ATPase subunit delta
MSSYRIAIRYANSLLELAKELNKVEEVKKDVDQFILLCKESRPFLLFMRNPVIQNQRKAIILKKIFEANFDKLTMSFFDLVTRKNRENILVEIANLFVEKYRDYRGIITARIQSAVKFDVKTKDRLINIIKESYGKDKKIEVIEHINKEMIGGYILTIKDRQFDESITKKLKELRHKLIN